MYICCHHRSVKAYSHEARIMLVETLDLLEERTKRRRECVGRAACFRVAGIAVCGRSDDENAVSTAMII